MGCGRKNTELTSPAKKPRESRRREKVQRKRLAALGVPDTAIKAMNTKELRLNLKRPLQTQKQWAKKVPAQA